MLAVGVGGDAAKCIRHILCNIGKCGLECAALTPVGTVSNEFTAALRDEGFCLFEDGIVFFG